MNLDELEKLAKAATPGPWVWDEISESKEKANVLYVEPHSDGSGYGTYDLISRDSGVYGPDVPTCEFIMAANPKTVMKLIAVARAAEKTLYPLPRDYFEWTEPLSKALEALNEQ